MSPYETSYIRANIRERQKDDGVTKKLMLINAHHEEESRVAIIEDGYLHELDIESAQKALTKSNIYKGRITKVEGSLQAAFVEYGANRQGFLPINEIHSDYWKEGVDKNADARKLNIQDILEPKQDILVQVVKEERGNKGAALTTYISLAGRYLVLSPNTQRAGISRKLSDEERKVIKAIIAQLEVPDTMGLIVRTAGKDQTLEALQRDYNYLRRLWDEIRIKSESAPSPTLIYLEGDLATRAIRDHFTDDINEIWVDNHEIYSRTKQFVHAVLPGKEKLVKLYRGKKPLFRHYNIEAQCEEIHEREIRLPSGGSIVLDPTEALTAIDVNSSRATKGRHIDDTALATNLEAAEEIARQLRIRDIGGLIVIDFIDMNTRKHNQQVEETLRRACKGDKARVQFARISRFGLLEMSRQRIHPSVRETTTEPCVRCQGRGFVRTVESMALQMLTRMEDWAEMGKKPTLVVQVPSDTGEYLMNNKRQSIARIEEVYDVQITLQIRKDLDIPHYRIERQWNENNQQRVEVLEDTMKNKRPPRSGRKLKPLKPVVGIPTPPPETKKAKKEKPKKTLNPLTKLIRLIVGDKKEEKAVTTEVESPQETTPVTSPSRNRRRRRSGGNRSNTRNQRNRTEVKETEKETTASTTPERKENTQGDENPQRRKPRRRRRRKPQTQQDGQGTHTNTAQQDADSDKPEQSPAQTADSVNPENPDKPRRRRRRRRPRRPAGEQPSAEQKNGESSGDGKQAASGALSASKDASTANQMNDGGS